MLRIDVITLFPDTLEGSLSASVLGRGQKSGLFDIRMINLRDFAHDRHQTVDDTPFGGGGGMVFKPEPLAATLDSLGFDFRNFDRSRFRLALTSASGRLFDQKTAVEFSLLDRLVIICGHYKGVDERILQLYPIDEISIGDYVLTGGEPAAWVLIDAVLRLVPGVMGNFESAGEDAFIEEDLLGAPVYTRPAEFGGLKVPEELLSGNHELIRTFRRRTALKKTWENRPVLLEKAELADEDRKYLKELEQLR